MSRYVAFVETGSELAVKAYLDNIFDKSGFSSIVPRRVLYGKKQGKIYKTLKNVFLGYIFMNIDMSCDN